jgi:hypothetical protein
MVRVRNIQIILWKSERRPTHQKAIAEHHAPVRVNFST